MPASAHRGGGDWIQLNPSHLSRDSDRSRQGERYEAIIRAHGPEILENLNTPNWPEVMSSEHGVLCRAALVSVESAVDAFGAPSTLPQLCRQPLRRPLASRSPAVPFCGSRSLHSVRVSSVRKTCRWTVHFVEDANRAVTAHTDGFAASLWTFAEAWIWSTNSRVLRLLLRFCTYSLSNPNQRSAWFSHDE